jgi:hypothetical protein
VVEKHVNECVDVFLRAYAEPKAPEFKAFGRFRLNGHSSVILLGRDAIDQIADRAHQVVDFRGEMVYSRIHPFRPRIDSVHPLHLSLQDGHHAR